MDEDVKEIFNKFKDKFKLPEYDVINKELEISSLDADIFLLRHIRNRIRDRLEHYCEIIEDLLQPDATLAMMHECSFVNEKTKSRIFTLYKKMMYLHRMADYLAIDKSNQENAKYIRSYFQHIDVIKREMKAISKLRMNSWKKELSSDIKTEYFG